nr:Gag-Pol polyprotein [Tanacetum cinerariifolium]
SPNKDRINKLKTQLAKEFEMKDLGPSNKILGMQIHRDRVSRKNFLSQKSYVMRILQSEKKRMEMSQVLYASAVGSLMFTMICTRPDIAHVVILTEVNQPPEVEYVAAAQAIKEAVWLKMLFYVLACPKWHCRRVQDLGASGGKPWDDGVNSAIKQVTVDGTNGYLTGISRFYGPVESYVLACPKWHCQGVQDLGASGGKPWDDGVNSAIKQVHVHIRVSLNVINAIGVEYFKSDGKTIWSHMHGATTGDKTELVTVDGTKGYLTGILRFYGPVERYNGLDVVMSIIFFTVTRRYTVHMDKKHALDIGLLP